MLRIIFVNGHLCEKEVEFLKWNAKILDWINEKRSKTQNVNEQLSISNGIILCEN